jgi:hypothetical protein
MDFINTSRSGRNEILTEIRSKDSGEKRKNRKSNQYKWGMIRPDASASMATDIHRRSTIPPASVPAGSGIMASLRRAPCAGSASAPMNCAVPPPEVHEGKRERGNQWGRERRDTRGKRENRMGIIKVYRYTFGTIGEEDGQCAGW